MSQYGFKWIAECMSRV